MLLAGWMTKHRVFNKRPEKERRKVQLRNYGLWAGVCAVGERRKMIQRGMAAGVHRQRHGTLFTTFADQTFKRKKWLFPLFGEKRKKGMSLFGSGVCVAVFLSLSLSSLLRSMV